MSFGSGSSEHRGAARYSHLDRSDGYTTSGSVYQHRFTRRQASHLEECMRGRQETRRKSRCVFDRHVIGNLEHMARWRQTLLGVPAGDRRADHTELSIQIPHSGEV